MRPREQAKRLDELRVASRRLLQKLHLVRRALERTQAREITDLPRLQIELVRQHV
jgi:hypothetical protein